MVRGRYKGLCEETQAYLDRVLLRGNSKPVKKDITNEEKSDITSFTNNYTRELDTLRLQRNEREEEIRRRLGFIEGDKKL